VRCNGQNWLIDRDGSGGLIPCPVCKVVQRDRIALLSRMNWLDARMKTWRFANYDQDVPGGRDGYLAVHGFCRDVIETWQECQKESRPFTMLNCKRGRWCVALYGMYGAGKTHLLASMINACAERAIPAIYAFAPDLWKHLGCVANPDDAIDYEARLVAMCQVPVLALDEPGGLVDADGDARVTHAARMRRTHIIEYRYANNLPTVIADQRDPDLWNDDRIADRIKEGINDAIYQDVPKSYRRRHETPEHAAETWAQVWDKGEGE
jgi:hypothetical protein